MKPATELIHHSDGASREASPLTTPIYETTTFLFQDAAEVVAYNEGRSSKYLYSRYANPTVAPVEQKIAALEGADSALVLSSGQAATTTALMALTASGDEVVCSSAIYGGTLHLFADLLPKFGIKPRFVSLEELARPETIFSNATKLVWFESPINPTLRCVDVAAVARACKARGVISVVDNTFASPINQQPIALGVDLVMHSATKYLNGHSDVTAGALAGPARLMDPILDARKKLGTVLDPYAAYALGRGLEDALRADGTSQRQRDGGRALACNRPSGENGLLPWPRTASGSCNCGEADARVWRNGVPRRRGRLRSCGTILRPVEGLQARGESRRRREPVQLARADVAVGTHGRGTRTRRSDAQHGAIVGRAGGPEDLIADLDQALEP